MAADGNEIEITVDVDDAASNKFRGIEHAAARLGQLAGDAISSIGSALASAGQSVGDFGGKMLSGAASTALMGAASTAATGGMNLLVGVLVAAAAAIPMLVGGFLALAPALLAAGGAAGAATAGLAGLLSVGATLHLGLTGLGDAWTAYGQKATGGGGSSQAAGKQAEASAIAVKNAEYSLTQAKRQAVAASEAVARAVENEKERLEDLTLAIRGQNIAQKEALKSLNEAKDKQTEAHNVGNDPERQAADDAVEAAQYQYDYVTERVNDLAQEKAKADKDGVAGSDQVKAAVDRQRDAQEQVVRAAEALSQAQKQVGVSAGGAAGGVNAFAQAMAKLSPNARAFIRELISISERLEPIRRQIQDRLFDGLDKSLERLATQWLPKLPGLLGGTADALNSIAKGAMKEMGKSDFMDGISKAVTAFNGVLEKNIGPAIDHIIHAFGVLAGESVEPLEKIGSFIERIAEKFDDWVSKDPGAVRDFMHDAANTLENIWDIGGKTFHILGQIVDILFPGSKKASGGVLDAVNDALDKVSEWLAKGENQKKLQGWIDDFVSFIGFVVDLSRKVDSLARTWIKAEKPIWKAIGAIGEALGNAWDDMKRIGGKMLDYFQALPGRMRSRLHGIFDGLKDSFRSALNWVVDRWNSLRFTMPALLGGATLEVPQLRHFASGGAGSGLAMVGEQGRELVRLPAGSSVMPHGDTERALGGGDRAPIVVQVVLDGKVIAESTVEPLREKIRRFGAGSAQQFWGRKGVTA